MHRRTHGRPPPFDASTRRRLQLALIVAAPIALAATLLETLFRNGATVHLAARKPARN